MTWTEITRREYCRDKLRYASDLTDDEWSLIAPFLPEPRRFGRPRTTDLRDVVEALFRHWVKADVFQKIFDAVSDDPDMGCVMIDGSIVRVHRHGQGAKGGLRARLSASREAGWPLRSWR